MTGEEKRRQLKEQYKRDLMARKEFLEKAKQLRKSQKMNKAISELTSSLDMEDTDAWIEHLNREAAITEAKMDVSLDSAKETGEDILKAQAMEAEQQKLSAELLVEQMKKEMGLVEEEPEPEIAPDSESETEAEPSEAEETSEHKPPRRRLGDF